MVRFVCSCSKQWAHVECHTRLALWRNHMKYRSPEKKTFNKKKKGLSTHNQIETSLSFIRIWTIRINNIELV